MKPLPLKPPSLLGACAVSLFALLPNSLHAVGFDQQSHTPSHDTFVQRAAPTSAAGSGDEFLVKRDSATVSGGSDRIGYLRFSTAAPYATVDSASLLISINNYPGANGTPFTFEVFGLPDGHPNESFNENLLTFNTATNATTSMPGSLNPAGLTSLGTFTTNTASGATRVEFSTPALRNFIAASGNSELTFVVFRQTANGTLPTYFASGEDSSTTKRPTLLIRINSDSLAVTSSTASSTLTGSAATNATDSNFNTRWIANADTSSTKSWITLDLGSPQTVNRMNFIAHQHGRSYKLESSNDNSTWNLITNNFRSGPGSSSNSILQDTNRYFQPQTARYFRISSLTSTTGNSMSIWEAKLYNDPNASPVLARIASLTSSVSSLPNNTNPEQLKRVVLELALERAQACLNIGDFTATNLLLDDAENNLSTAPATMAAPATGLTQISAIRPLIEPNPAINPYLKRINDGAALHLSTTTDLPWEKNTRDLNVLADFNLARTTAGDMDALLWVFAHPNSALRHHPEILRRLLRRTYAYLDAINVHGPQIPAGQLASFYDDFASAPATIVFREFQLLYPGLIPTNSNNEWNHAMTTAANNLWEAFKNRKASWVNTDVAIAVELHNLGMKTGRQDLIDKGRYFIDDVLTSGRMFPDGAVGYIGTQNEAGGYQGTVTTYVNRYYQITNRPQALEILQKMEWYGPINGGMIDWWTSPSWKQAWNFNSGSGQTGEPTNGKNPYTRAGLDASIGTAATATNWSGAVMQVGWYEPGTTAITPPETYTVFDRNIQGPRSWQGGLWNTTGTLRAINDSESGHSTIMGAQVMDPAPNFRVNASVMGVFPRIRTATGGSRDSGGGFAATRHAWLTSKLTGNSTVTPDFTAIGASHKIHTYGSSIKGTEHDWTARQVWLNLPDRTIGLLDLAPNTNLTAYEVQGAIRLGFGGTAYSATKTLVATAPNTWNYGNLRIKLHAHNYAEVVPEQYEFRRSQAPITEITLRDQIGGASNDTLKTYSTGTRWKYLAEISPNTTTDEVTVTEVAETGGLIGINVVNPTTHKRHRVLYNPGTATVTHKPTLNWDGPIRIHRSGTHFRPDWLPAPSGTLPVNLLTADQSITLDAKTHVVLELLPIPEVGVIITSPSIDPVTLASTSQALQFTSSITQNGAGTPVFSWSKTSGPGTATFSDPTSPNSTATFSTPGTYVLRLSCTVAPTTTFAERTIIVQPPGESSSFTNPLPNTSPGPAPDATVGSNATLFGTTPNATSTQWQKISGPGNVVFANATFANTTATFDRAGTYLLRLTATNSNGTSFSDLTVTVSHANAFSAWQELHWGLETNPTIIGPNADPDNDGLANLAEFYAATNPKLASSNAPNLWTTTLTHSPLPWSVPAHWTYGTPPLATPATALEFLTNQTLAAGTITANHDLASPFNLNLLTLNGSSTAAARFVLTGNTLQLSSNGSTTPTLNLNATGTLSYELASPVTLNANTTAQGNGSASFEITGPLSGSGTLTKNGTSKLTLSGNNSFTGAITHNAGKLTLTHSNALGTSTKTLSMQGTNRVLELSNNITLPASLTINASSNSFDAGGIHNLSGNNRINGKINFSTGNPSLNIASSSGTLTIANSITLTTTSRTLHLGGSSTTANTIAGTISQNSPTNALSLIKQGIGTWILAGTNTHTGSTSLNTGTLVVNGSITDSSSLTVAANATLAGNGNIASPTTVHGILSPGHDSADSLTFSAPLNLSKSAAVDWDLNTNTTNGPSFDQITAPTAIITQGALVKLFFNGEDSSVSFADPFWLTERNWPILTATDLTGALSLGSVSSDSNGISPEDGHGRFSLENTNTGTTLHWTPFTDLESWRLQNFGNTENAGAATNALDFDHDNLSNVLEWALDLDPKKPSTAPTTLALESNTIRYTYTRRKAAANEATFSIEWSDTLTNPWPPVGPGTLQSETDTQQTLQAAIPKAPGNRRFIRLKVTTP